MKLKYLLRLSVYFRELKVSRRDLVTAKTHQNIDILAIDIFLASKSRVLFLLKRDPSTLDTNWNKFKKNT